VLAQIPSGEAFNLDYSSPKEYIIAGITVTGVKYLDNNVLIMLSGLTIGDKVKVPGDKITQAIRKLWDQGLFEDVKISISQIVDNQLYLNFYLKERPRLNHFSFNGIKKSDADNIREKIHISKGEYVTENMIMRTKNIIRKYYTDKGFLNADVEIVQKKDTSSSNEVSLTIDIHRNGKVRVYNILIHGNHNLTTEQLKAGMKKTKEKGVFNPMNDIDKMLYQIATAVFRIDFGEIANIVEKHAYNNIRFRIFKSAKFIREDYNEDKDLLITKYNNQGYRDAKIIKDSVSKNDDNTVSIDIWVEEGPKYYFRNITWVGNTKYPKKGIPMTKVHLKLH
jgi:outer membrane protein insertion porin family